MENKTISYLNSKIWYRGLKVVYILVQMLVLFGIIIYFLNNEVVDKTRSKVICQYGNKMEFVLKDVEYKDILKLCEIDKVITREDQPSGIIWDPYRIEDVEKIDYGSLVLSLFAGIIIFEVLFRRTFYYVVLGAIIPEK